MSKILYVRSGVLSVITVIVASAVMSLTLSCNDNGAGPPDGPVVTCPDGSEGPDCYDGPPFVGNSPVIINEINSSNIDYRDVFGDTPGWVEIYNPADTAVDLGGYVLTSSHNRRQWRFGDVVMEPRSYLVVFMSGRNIPDFESESGEVDLLGQSVGVWSWADSENDPPGGSTAEEYYVSRSMIGGKLHAADNRQILGWTTAFVMLKLAGWDTTNVVDLAYSRQIHLRGYLTEGTRLEIRLAQSGMNDWETWPIVIRGTGEPDALYTVDLPPNDPVYPNLQKIYGLRFGAPGNFYGDIEFSFNSITAIQRASDLHASFELGTGGGQLFLFDPEDRLRDTLSYPASVRGMAYAKRENGRWGLSEPTPGAANEKVIYNDQAPNIPAGIIPESGYHGNELTFTLPAGTNETVILCDTTGRLPTADSPLRSGMTLAFAHPSVMRCAQFRDGSYRSEPIMRTYILGRLPSLPIVSVAVDPVEMFDPVVGLYENGPGWTPELPHYGANFWREDVLGIHIEFFEPGAQRAAWSQGGGLRIFGNYSRGLPKKSVLISFRRGLGTSRLNYPLFPEHPHLTRFSHILLRNNGNNANRDYIRDMMSSSLTEGLGMDYQKGRSVVVFYNGRYFGIHNLRERSNGDYFETNYGINEDLVDLVRAGGEVSRGSDADYQVNVQSWLSSLNGFSDDNLRTLGERIDVGDFMNHYSTRIYLQDKDWPGNNMKRWRTHTPPSKWKWFMYDTDQGFGNTDMHDISYRNMPMLEFATSPTTSGSNPYWPNPPHSTLILRKLLENDNGKHAFINRFSLMLATYFAPQRVGARIDALMSLIESEIPYDQERWRWNVSWMNTCLNTMRRFGETRAGVMQSEIEAFFEIDGAVDFTITSSGSGKVFVHDLEVPNGNATFKAYAQVPMVLRAEPAGGMVFQGWSDGETAPERAISVDETMTLTAVFGGAF